MVIAIPCAVGFITLAKPILNMLYFTQDNTTAALMLQMGALSVVFSVCQLLPTLYYRALMT